MPESWGTCPGKLLTGVEPVQERSVLQSMKLKGVGDLKSILTTDTEMQSLEFTQLIFGLSLIPYFLIMFPFGMVMYILCHCILEVCDLLFHFDLTGVTVKRLHESQKRL
ncbi:hypothetical protein I79_024307 [Cricetulus griseus]|uniref:Uncharacterized protein n=1 Tax=Cricetulus griseus TaxID=10029 RepID=G3IKA8_CRIGR|nr:hypothetical protein I79_024307 [Cricetulus griseus]